MGQAFSLRSKIVYPFWSERTATNQWQTKIDRLADRKISWEQFFDEPLSGDHPGLDVVTSRGGQSLLHLAVLQKREDWVAKLESYLSSKQNGYGLTASELAKFLNPVPKGSFNVPHVAIEHPEKIPSFTYLDEPIFESTEIFDLVLERTAKLKERDEIPGEKIWMGIYFNKEVQKGHPPKLTLKHINDQLGFGIFAAQRIPACTFIGEYTGVIKERKKKVLKDNYYCVQYNSWDNGRKKYVIDAGEAGNFTRFINHSGKPNLGLQSIYWRGLPRMVLVSMQEIAEGTQLTFDYGNLFWKDCPLTPIPIG